MHPRVSLHQVAFLDQPTTAFLDHARALGLGHVTLVTGKLDEPGVAEALAAPGAPQASTTNHVFAVHPNLPDDTGEAAARLNAAIAASAQAGARQIYLISGGRGRLSWEAAAQRFAALIAPCRQLAQEHGIRLLVENASALNADIHMAHTLDDALLLAETADIGVCVELHACWMESGLAAKFRRALPRIGLVQVSDYVPGDRSTPCRAVPGDGMVPLEALIADLLDAGYAGLFDLELVGPRIVAEGAARASARAADYLSNLLVKLGA